MGFLKLGVASVTGGDGPALHDEGSILRTCCRSFGVLDGLSDLDTCSEAVQMLLQFKFG